MAFRVFISLIVIICAYLAFETIRYKLIQSSLLNEEPEYVLGNPDGDLTLVNFIDYSCPPCREGHPYLDRALQNDGNVKYIPRPISVLDAKGINAALLPYAAAKQGKFSEMHYALIENYRMINDQVLQDLSLEIGVDHQQLKTDLEDKVVLEAFEKNMNLLKSYRLESIPSYAIDRNILFSPKDGVSVNEFLAIFGEARGE